ncbi:protein PSK SIMULATOR 1 [Raphanus sativus]|uniref:Protein PSK SIMULATOR 1 n=1 Tax=Raphanus sativus TaxID=3726 RepID=A0A6J0MFH9_RAPSA|nr:protein PSK SIMULATOR 1 [Raphanus sativus]XP_018471217.2 protein PSK SIMULATOR 1 [Raphanus sativus]
MVSETWFRNLLRFPKKNESHKEKKDVLGVLAYEVASLLSKLVHLWQSLSDKNVTRLRQEITRSTGIKKLVSEDDDFVVRLIRDEMMESVEAVAKAVARLAARCNDPKLKSFESCFGEMMKTGADPYGWQFGWKKMDRKAKRMERFISSNASLYQETEILTELEQSLKRRMSNESATDNLLEYKKKVTWKRHEVKNLREVSLWNRTYDYTVLLLVRSVFTILTRTKHVFGISYRAEASDVSSADSDFIARGHSVSTVLTHQSETTTRPPRFASGPLGRFTGPASGSVATKSTKMGDFLSGSLSAQSPKSGPLAPEKNKRFKFYSGPLGKFTSKSGPLMGMGKHNKKTVQQTPERPSVSSAKKQSKPNRLTQIGPFKGCMVSQDGVTPLSARTQNGARNSSAEHHILEGSSNAVHVENPAPPSRPKLSDAAPNTLGAACLALHYANVIIVIERFVASPHLIGDDARDDLYNMLTASVRKSLRERLKPYSKNLSSSAVYDPGLAKEWTDAMAGILEWLGPLAHNMIKWQSERSYENQSLVSRTHIVLAQTLFFANQQKTETIITELLVGLNYVWRYGRELNAKALQECTSSQTLEKCLDTDN